MFVAVAQAGGLSAATASTGLSAATLGRHISALEQKIGQPLFHRAPTGYDLTELGEDFLAQTKEVAEAMAALNRWGDGHLTKKLVRIAAGAWTSAFLSQQMPNLWHADLDISIELVTGVRKVDIGHRHAEIGIRNERPQENWLAGRRLCDVAYALYAQPHLKGEYQHPFIGVTGELANTRSARWLEQFHADHIVLRGNSVLTVREMAAAGLGNVVLPCFVGDQDTRLARIGDPINELRSEQWLVMHHEERHRPAVRTVANRLADVIQGHKSQFLGET